MGSEEVKIEKFNLKGGSELRFCISQAYKTVFLEVQSGVLEVFGAELRIGRRYPFRCGAKMAFFTYRGATFTIEGGLDRYYISSTTEMRNYLETHAYLEQRRYFAKWNEQRGPIVMIVGPPDVGKSTLTRILLNYAIKQRRKPVMVDLDVNEGIYLPGTMGSAIVDRYADSQYGFRHIVPMVYQFGYMDPDENDVFYKGLIAKVASDTRDFLEENDTIKYSGAIINTIGWKEEYMKYLRHAIVEFDVDIIYVLDHEPLYSQLKNEANNRAVVKLLSKSQGVLIKNPIQRNNMRVRRLMDYFFGPRPESLHFVRISFTDIRIYKIYIRYEDVPSPEEEVYQPHGKKAYRAALRALATSVEKRKTTLYLANPNHSMITYVLAPTYCKNVEDDVILHRYNTNVNGFVLV